MLTLTKKILLIISFMILFLSFIINPVNAIVKQTTDFYTNDSANVLSETTENYIININKELYSKTGAQIVVATVTSLDGMSVEDYALQMFRSYGIGSKDKNNGILFLISTSDRKTRIEVGYGLEGRITDGKAGRILDNYVVPYLKNDDWENGIKNGFNTILEEVEAEYNITIDGTIPSEVVGDIDSEYDNLYISGIIVFFICTIIKVCFDKPTLKYGLGITATVIASFITNSMYTSIPFMSCLIANGIGMIIAYIGIFSRRRLLWW